MPDESYLILLFVGLLWIFCGAISVWAPKRSVIQSRKLYRKLRFISEQRLNAPVTKRRILLERLEGCTSLALGIVLIYYLPIRYQIHVGNDLVLTWETGGNKDKKDSSLKEVVEAVTRLEATSEPAPRDHSGVKSLHITRARYGASGTWIDVTKQIRKAVCDHRLSIRASNAIAGDPLFGTTKNLTVDYVLDGVPHTARAQEGEMLRIPPEGKEQATWQAIRTPQQLISLAKLCPADVSFYGKNLTTGQAVAYQPDQPACLASIVKIFVLLEVMRQADQGTMDPAKTITFHRGDKDETCTISAAVDLMIGMSDNDATNTLAARVGYDRVNSLPAELGISGLSSQVLPEPGVLEKVLDKKVFAGRQATSATLLPQHGTARGIAAFFELLNDGNLINKSISKRVLEVFDRNPKNFAPQATPLDFKSGGKGGSLAWKRPFRAQYNMTGWGLLLRNEETALTFCLLCEWFPERMSEEEKWEWDTMLSDCIVHTLLTYNPEPTGKESTSQPNGSSDTQMLHQ